MQQFLYSINKSTPLTDKILAATGAAVSGGLSLGSVNTGIAILVGLLTALVLIPRVILAWRDLIRRLHEDADKDDAGTTEEGRIDE